MVRVERRKTFRRRFSQAIWLLFVAFLATSVWADFDSGDISVIEADPTILQPGEDFDLGGKMLTFTPKAGGGYTIGIAVGAINPNLGTNLALGDDASTGALPLGFSFPFFGTSYSSVFTNSNGYVTFAAASGFINFNSGSDLSTVLDRIAEGFPRIAGLWNDLDPTLGGGVFFNALPDRVLITWNAVPRFGAPGTSHTFQITLFPSGGIQLTYGSISPASTHPVFGGFLVGISPGGSSQFFTTTLDFHIGSGGSVSTFPNLEPLVQVFGSMPNPLVHIPAVARRFYRSHGDSLDQIVMFANFSNTLGPNVLAFEFAIRVSMTGTGQSIFNATSFFGSAGRLHSMLNMNRLSVYPNDLNCLADPTCRPFGNDSTLTLMGQESGHQWLAFLRFDDGGVNSDLLLGRDNSHWSFFLDSDASNMEGNNWVDNGNGTFTSNELTIRYSPLDQYAMGLRSAGEVPNFFFIRNPSGTTRTRSSSPEVGVTVSGTRQDVSISQITAIAGSRPSGFTGVNPTTVWHQAFILLVKVGTTPSPADMTKIDTIRSAWIPYFANAVSGRGSISTNLASTPSLPDLVPSINSIPSTGTVGGTIQLSASVVNQGAGAAGAFRLGFYFSGDTTITTGDLFFASCQISGLAAGTSTTCSGPVTIPASLPPGVYFVGVIADDQGAVGESNESNDTALTGPITVSVAQPPSAAAAFVIRLYQQVLNRAPDPAGLQGHLTDIQTFGSVVSTVLAFFHSEEFLARDTSNEEFLTICYRTFLNREPDQAGFTAFLTALQAGQLTRDNLLDIFIDSQEFASQASFLPPLDPVTAFVTTLYVRILGRGPDQAGLTGFVTQLTQTRTVLPTVQFFLASAEFLARNTTNTEFVTLLYRVFLDRVPDAGGLAGWVALLNQGTATRAQLVLQFAASPEFHAIQQQLFP